MKNIQHFALVALAFSVTTFAGIHSAVAQDGTWTAKTPMPEPRIVSAAGVVGGRLYVVGGSTGNGASTIPEIYDPNTDTWSYGSPAGLPRGAMATGVLNNKVYVAGGWINSDANASTSALEIYDPATGSWANGAPMAIARGATASAVIGGKLYAAGGNAAYPYHALHTLEIYDPISDTWSSGAPMPVAVSFAGGAVINDKFYVVGGVSINETPPTATLQVYDPILNTWITGAPMPTPRYGHVVGVIDGKLYAVSGHDGTTLVPNVEIYDPGLNSWTTGAPLPQPCSLMVAGMVGSQMFVAGGYNLSGGISGALQVYTPASTPPPAPLEFAGFLSPIGGSDATGGSFASPLRTFKMGSTVPVKFTASSGGSPVLTGVHTLQAVKYSDATTSTPSIDATPQDAATTGNRFRLTDGQWQFNLDTKATGMSVGIWQLIVTLSDGSRHRVWIQLK